MIKKLHKDDKAKRIIGKRLRYFREHIQMGQKEMAAKIGLSKSTIVNFENGKIIPGVRSLIPISLEFHIDIDWLLNGQNPMFLRNEEKKKMYKELERLYRVPEVAISINATLLEAREKLADEITDFFFHGGKLERTVYQHAGE